MGYFKERKVKKVYLPSTGKKYWIDLYDDELEYGDLIAMGATVQDGEVNMMASAGALLAALAKEWNLDDEEGNIMPINKENINRLKQADAIFLVDSLSASVELDTKTQKKTSTKQ
jgi:HD-like signal output (HDOD) protein